jgi:hypothetical protein
MNEGGRTDAKTENAKGVWARMKTTEVEDRSRSWNRKRSLRRGLAENGDFSEVPTGTSHVALSVMRNHVSTSISRRDDRPDRARHSCLDRKDRFLHCAFQSDRNCFSLP